MIDSQRGAKRRVGYNHLIFNKREWNNCFIKNHQQILLDFVWLEQPEGNLMDAISRVWYNGSYTIADKPIKTLELHHTMIQFLIIVYITQVNSAFRALWLVNSEVISKYYSPPTSLRERFLNLRPLVTHKITFWSANYSACVVYTKTIIHLSVGESDGYLQELITRSLQLPNIPVTAFSQTDLFLVWIYLEFRFPQEPQWPIAITSTD